jgi:hypothetical protein
MRTAYSSNAFQGLLEIFCALVNLSKISFNPKIS